ncbi:DUF4867 family protein [Butyrivibrio sp. MC2013]|uniref:DUF4867 family protein n=1 Tax=Butyrivibrio sp. MC2013 TaxID=1280686 RepID=UPI000401FC6C|nr:DUF4867 family protein [Butyrivibrio sp. MC2013]
MKIYNVTDPEFKKYGRVVEGVKVTDILKVLDEDTPCPEDSVAYLAEEPKLQCLEESKVLADSLYGGTPVQFGWCNGHNTRMNCLEYHRSSEFNLGTEDFILLLAGEWELDDDYKLDSSLVKAFLVPKGVLVEVFATSLHYAPCQGHKDKGFKVLIALPQTTNQGIVIPKAGSKEDKLLFARNKWLIAHSDAPEAGDGAYVGISGENIDVTPYI